MAQVTGKIAGNVTNSSNEALTGVNVYIENHPLGASTDADGFFVIMNITPGVYTLTATFIGYQSVTIQQVVVKPDLTTPVDFVLPEHTLEMTEAIVVTAREPVIQRDATAKNSTMNAQEIEALPINNLQEILATQSNVSVLTNTPNAKAGYNIRGIDDVRMRGGRNNEVALLVDGVKVSNPVFGGFGTQIGKNAIQQISIESGGFSAKYGNALSGVINLTTREGRDKPSGAFRYYTSQPFGVSALTSERGAALNRQNFQFSTGGKIAVGNKLSYFLSAELNKQAGTVLEFDKTTWDKNRTIKLGDSTHVLPTSREIIAGYKRYGVLDSIQKNLATNWKKVVGPDGRTINPMDMFSGWQGMGWNNSYNVFAKLGYSFTPALRVRFSGLLDRRYRQLNNFNAWYIYNMSGQNVQLLGSDKQTLSINYTFSNTSFMDLRLSRFYESRKVRILKDYGNKYSDWYNPFSPASSNLKTPAEYTPYLSADAKKDPFENAFYMVADNRWYSGDESTNWEARMDLTSQFHKKYKVEGGFQVNYIDLKYHSYQNVSDVDVFPTIYHRTPLEAAVYTQFKAELENIIINAGVRLDYNDSGGSFWADPFAPLSAGATGDSVAFNKKKKVEPKLNISPRIGIAYPLTTTTVLFFNFGHFYQNPNYRDLYRASGSNQEVSVVRGNIIGNPNLKPEKSVQYELSLQQELIENIGLKVNLWSKETTNQVGSVVVPAYSDPQKINPFTYSVFVNNNFGSARGLDVELKRAMVGSFGFNLSYTWSESKVLQPTSWDGYWSGDTKDDKPQKETTSPWDQTHVVRANAQYYLGKEQGPNWLGTYWLQNSVFSIIYYGESGLPYTPTIPGGVITEPYSQRWPSSHRVDLRTSKSWKVFGQRLRASFEVKNLFDRKNVLTGYTRTGSATNPGTASYYTRSSSYWDSRNNNNFALRRTFYFGLEFLFGDQ